MSYSQQDKSGQQFMCKHVCVCVCVCVIFSHVTHLSLFLFLNSTLGELSSWQSSSPPLLWFAASPDLDFSSDDVRLVEAASALTFDVVLVWEVCVKP